MTRRACQWSPNADEQLSYRLQSIGVVSSPENSDFIPKEVLFHWYIMGLLAHGVPISITKDIWMKRFLAATVGLPASPEAIYDQVAFKTEEKILKHVRSNANLQQNLHSSRTLAD